MRANPRVCLQVDEIRDELDWQSVIVYGTYEEVTCGVEREHAMSCLLERFRQLTPVESLIAADVAAPAPIVFRIRIEALTGLSEG
jgi:nitroimidazol reductase NimA-like FMN-containing flavoprotein (pyridoxamine 5'-phosphate oxidase superfamily)